MAEHMPKAKAYVVIGVGLVVLTLLSTGVSFIPLPTIWHLYIGAIIGACKASLVGLFFMHVLYSPRLTWLLIVVVFFWMLILFTLTLTDYFSREIVPWMPGH
jgi:cytochrome c oxidase subunit 4